MADSRTFKFWWGFGKFCAICLGAAIGTFAFFILAAFAVGHPVHDAFSSAYGLLFGGPPKGLTVVDKTDVDHLVKIGAVLPAQDVLEGVSHYYEGVIQTLITLFAIVGFVAFMYIKAVSGERAEEAAETKTKKAVDQYFGSHSFFKLAQELAAANLAPTKTSVEAFLKDAGEKFEGVDDAINDIGVRLQAMEQRLARLDKSEEGGASDTLQSP